MTKIFSPRWDKVARRDVVEVSFDGKFVQTGIVDECTSDGDFVWLLDSLGERRLFHEHDGYNLEKLDR
jgi:hypothetical protein